MPPPNAPHKSDMLLRPLEAWGGLWNRAFELVGGVSYLVFDVTRWLLRGLARRGVRLGRTAIITQMVRVGFRSTGIVFLVCACIGFILALQMAPTLSDFGQQDKIANIVGVAILRELGPLVAAVVLAGFAGASIAAEIGTMVVGEEIEALEAHALDPIRFLVVPRVIATTASLVLLTVVADVTGVAFGGLMAVGFLGVPYELYESNTLNQLVMSDFLTGLVKAGVFGLILSALACYNGLRVTGGAMGVGLATTHTVVQTVVAVIIADLCFTAIFYATGLN